MWQVYTGQKLIEFHNWLKRTHLLKSVLTEPTIYTIVFGDLNISLMKEATQKKSSITYFIDRKILFFIYSLSVSDISSFLNNI